MATPTNPGRVPPSASTPSHLGPFSSPAPRSVQSPAAHRNTAGKSPLHAAATSSAHKDSTGPSAALNFESPAALGLSLSSIGGGLDGSVGMGISMSGMSGLQAFGLSARQDEEERRRRLDQVVAALRGRTGRVGKEGVERICRREGLDIMWESEMRLTAAGKVGMLEIDFRPDDSVSGLSLSFPLNTSALTDTASAAAALLQSNLTPPKTSSPLTWTLDAFAANLGRLARLDNLSKGGVNCYDAISGVYKSLESLSNAEKALVVEQFASQEHDEASTRDARAEREVLCNHSGRPRLNANGRIGLSLEYWTRRRRIGLKKPHVSKRSGENADAMDTDTPNGSAKSSQQDKEEASDTFSLNILPAPYSSALYTALRVSNAWLSDPPLDPTTHSPVWTEPPPTYLTPDADETKDTADDAMALDDGVGKLPNVRFVAKLEPPLVLPLQTCLSLLAMVGCEVPPETVRPTGYESLVLGKEKEEHGAGGSGEEVVRAERRVMAPPRSTDKKGALEEKLHRYALFSGKTEYGRVLEEIPFQHPRQIIAMLPELRQYALLTTLLTAPFTSPSPPLISSEASASIPERRIDLSLTLSPVPHLTMVIPRTLSTTSSAPETTSHFSTENIPKFSTRSTLRGLTLDELVDPFSTFDEDGNLDEQDGGDPKGATNNAAQQALKNGKDAITLTVAVMQNGVLDIVGADGIESPSNAAASGSGNEGNAEEKKAREAREGLRRGLEVCEDLGIWAEWIVGGGVERSTC